VLGLVAACETLVQGFAERAGLEVLTEFPEELARLPQDSEMALFRILQESLTNVHRHSESHSALVRLHRHDDLLVLEIKDFGRGMAQNAGEHGVGIAGMRERMWQLGGELQVDSTPGGGATIRALLPVAALQEPATKASGAAVDYRLPTGK
jgi:two-component system NarL family sensor kinase